LVAAGLNAARDLVLDRRHFLPQPRHFTALALDLLVTRIALRLDPGQFLALLFQQLRLSLGFRGLLCQFAVAFLQLLRQRSGPVVVSLALTLDFPAAAVPEDAVGLEFAGLFLQVPLTSFQRFAAALFVTLLQPPPLLEPGNLVAELFHVGSILLPRVRLRGR